MPNHIPFASLYDTRLDGVELIRQLAADIKAELINSRAISETLFQDSSATVRYFVRQTTIDQTTGIPSTVFLNPDSTVPSLAPVLPVSPVKASGGNAITEAKFTTTTAGTGYAIGDEIAVVRVISTVDATILASAWYGATGLLIATPPAAATLIDSAASSRTIRTIVAAVTVLAGQYLLAGNSQRESGRISNNTNKLMYVVYANNTASPAVPSASNFDAIVAPLTAAPLTPIGLPSYEIIEPRYKGEVKISLEAGAVGDVKIVEFV